MWGRVIGRLITNLKLIIGLRYGCELVVLVVGEGVDRLDGF